MTSDTDWWRDGDPLNFAWFGHAPDELKKQYTESGGSSERRSMTLKVMMQGEVRLKVARGDLIAWGIQTAAQSEEQPRQVPGIYFETAAVEIDWSENVIAGLGRRFEDVRVTRPAAAIAASATLQPHEPDAGPTTKRGRKPLDDILRQAIIALSREEAEFADWSLEKQNVAVRAKAKEQHPGRFRGQAMPGRTTVYRYLKTNPVV